VGLILRQKLKGVGGGGKKKEGGRVCPQTSNGPFLIYNGVEKAISAPALGKGGHVQGEEGWVRLLKSNFFALKVKREERSKKRWAGKGKYKLATYYFPSNCLERKKKKSNSKEGKGGEEKSIKINNPYIEK